MVEQLTNSLQTRCTGRYLIDLPSSVKTDGEATIQKVSITSTPLSHEEYQEMIADLIKDRRNRTGDAPRNDYPYVYESGSVPGIEEGYFFVTNSPGSSGDGDPRRTLEAYKWDQGYQIFLKVNAVDFIHSTIKDAPSVRQMPMEDQYDIPQQKALIIDLLRRIQGRPDDVIPTTPGLCFAGGFLPGKSGSGEEIQDAFALPDRPDVMFTFNMQTDGSNPISESMPNRLPKIRAYLKQQGGDLIRTGTVQLQGMQADELLIGGTFIENVKGHEFQMEANVTTGGPMTPLLSFNMNNGNNSFLVPKDTRVTKASLTESEAIAIWDLVSRTLRPRPNGF